MDDKTVDKKTVKMRNKFLVTASVIVALFVLVFAVIQRMSGAQAQNAESARIYYFDSQEGVWKNEPFAVKSGPEEDMVSSVLSKLLKLPEQIPFSKTVPKDVTFTETLFRDNTVEIVLSEEFGGLFAFDVNVCVASVVYSLTSMPFVEYVHFYVGSQEMTDANGLATGLINRQSLILDSELLPMESSSRTLKLYFANADNTKLVPVERVVENVPDKSIVSRVIEELAKGPDDKTMNRLVPAEAKLREDVRVDTGICYVDFTADFINKAENENIRRLLVYSIVNSLIDNSSARQVQILINGDKTEETPSVLNAVNISRPLEKNETLVEGYIEPPEEKQ